MPDNPYAAPQASVVDLASVQTLPGWTAARLRLLGWLSLFCVPASLVLLVLAVMADESEPAGQQAVAEGLSLLLTLVGSYLLLCLKAFAQARFAAQGLGRPAWLVVIAGMVLEMIDLTQAPELFQQLNWQSISYLVFLLLYGLALLWLGIRLLRVANVYPSFRLLAWLDIAGGVLLVSVIGVLLAVVPLLGSSLALTAVFWRGAAEQKDQSQLC